MYQERICLTMYSDKKFTPNHSGEHNASIDGTGVLASTTSEIASNILNFFNKNETFKDVVSILDVGAGQGYFQKIFEECSTRKYDVWSIEGSNQVPFVANSDRRICCDFTKNLTEEYNKAFDMVVSFECIEHVPEDLQYKFWENVFYCSDRALVGIHCLNQTDHLHCFIKSDSWWLNFFKEQDIEVEDVYSTPNNPWKGVSPHECSLICLLRKGR